MFCTIEIEGKPIGKARARVTKTGIAFTPKKTANWESYARLKASEQMQSRVPTDKPVKLTVSAFFTPANSWPKWKLEQANKGVIAHTAKPDLDNIVKICKDSLNGVVWADDAQVVRVEATKSYSDVERVLISVTELDLIPQQVKTKEAA